MYVDKIYSMANINKSVKRASGIPKILSDLPFEVYLHTCENRDEYYSLINNIRINACINSDLTIRRMREGSYRPNALLCREIAKVIAKHSGDDSWTGEKLFPRDYPYKITSKTRKAQ